MTLPTTDELKELREEITSGPWDYDEDGGEILGTPHMSGGVLTRPIITNYGVDHWDSKLIALAPELLDELIRRREEAGQ